MVHEYISEIELTSIVLTFAFVWFIFTIYLIKYSFNYVTHKPLGYVKAIAIALLSTLVAIFFTNMVVRFTLPYPKTYLLSTLCILPLATMLVTKTNFGKSCLVSLTTYALSFISFTIVQFLIMVTMALTGIPHS